MVVLNSSFRKWLDKQPRTMVIGKVEFRKWLEKQSQTTAVGFACNPCYCPIAMFLRDKLHLSVSVYPQTNITIDNEDYPVPKWVKKFIHIIDDIFAAGQRNSPIKPQQCLKILAKI